MSATVGSLTHEAAAPGAVRRHARVEVVVAFLLAIGIAGVFWGAQRYPSLLKKLHSGNGCVSPEQSTFDALVKVEPSMPLPVRIGRTAGRELAVDEPLWDVFRAAIWCGGDDRAGAVEADEAQRVPVCRGERCMRGTDGRAGRCVHELRHSIAQSLLVSGVSTRMTLAAMISSPSFNPVVIAMAIALLPWRIAAARIVVPALLLLLLPLLVKERDLSVKALSLDEESPNLLCSASGNWSSTTLTTCSGFRY